MSRLSMMLRLYVKAGPNEALVISGPRRRVIKGGGTFVVRIKGDDPEAVRASVEEALAQPGLELVVLSI